MNILRRIFTRKNFSFRPRPKITDPDEAMADWMRNLPLIDSIPCITLTDKEYKTFKKRSDSVDKQARKKFVALKEELRQEIILEIAKMDVLKDRRAHQILTGLLDKLL